MGDDYLYHQGKQPGRTYVSKLFGEWADDASSRLMRYVSKVVDSDSTDECIVEGGEVLIRRTDGGRQEIQALFYEDDRSFASLTFQRFSEGGKQPHKHRFTFRGEEISKVLRLFETARWATFDESGKATYSDEYIDSLLEDDAALLSLLKKNRSRLAQLNTEDLVHYLDFSERKRQLDIFEALLMDDAFFERMSTKWGKNRPEGVWQDYFQRNPWIFGLSFSPIFLDSLNLQSLEQVVAGHSVASGGKRVDALMRTKGVIGSLCFIELKSHKTALLHSGTKPYRRDSWRISDEIAGAVAQCQKTVRMAIDHIGTRLNLVDSQGSPTGEQYFLHEPRSYLIAGQLDQFTGTFGPNESKFGSFELFRRHLRSPEIITFDELLERARAAVTLGARD